MTIQEQIVAARVAQAAIKDYTQEQIDKLVYEVAKIIYKNAEPLAREAVDETRLGCYEDKIAKNTDTPATFWAYLKDKKSVGIISEDAVSGVMEIAHPIGVIGAITPATNPTVTPLGNFMHALKGKNALVVCPAPRAQKTSTDTINLMRQALVANGAPADLVQAVEEPTLEHSAELMAECDLLGCSRFSRSRWVLVARFSLLVGWTVRSCGYGRFCYGLSLGLPLTAPFLPISLDASSFHQ